MHANSQGSIEAKPIGASVHGIESHDAAVVAPEPPSRSELGKGIFGCFDLVTTPVRRLSSLLIVKLQFGRHRRRTVPASFWSIIRFAKKSSMRPLIPVSESGRKLVFTGQRINLRFCANICLTRALV